MGKQLQATWISLAGVPDNDVECLISALRTKLYIINEIAFRKDKITPVNSIFLISETITLSHSIGKKMNHRYQSFTRIGRQFQSLERQVYADWTSVSFLFCQRGCLIWRIMTKTLTNTITNTYVVIFLSVSIFDRGYHSRQRVDTIKREMFSQKSVRRFVGDSSAFVMGAMFLASALNRGISPRY